MAVVKVMFTAIVTAMVGLFALSAAGILDLGELYLEPTNLAAQALGGLVFGAGFIVGGYCPGTSIAAIATGRKDAMMFALGMLAGVYAYAELTPGIEGWIKATAQGEMTLPSVTGAADGVVRAGVRGVPGVRRVGHGPARGALRGPAPALVIRRVPARRPRHPNVTPCSPG